MLSPSDLALQRVKPEDIFGGNTIDEAKALFEKAFLEMEPLSRML